MIQTFDVLMIVVSGLMVGNEFSVAAFIHPAFDLLPDTARFPSAVIVARMLGRVMPFWYGLVLLLTLIDAVLRHHTLQQWPALVSIAALLWAVSIVYTVAALVPINSRIASWTESSRPSDWKHSRHRWDMLHRWRVLLLIISFTCLVVGVVGHPVPSFKVVALDRASR